MLADGVGTLSVGVQRAAECIQCIGESPSSLERVAAGCIQQLSMTRHAGREFPFARWQSPGEWRITGRRIVADHGGSWRIVADSWQMTDRSPHMYACFLAEPVQPLPAGTTVTLEERTQRAAAHWVWNLPRLGLVNGCHCRVEAGHFFATDLHGFVDRTSIKSSV